MKTRLGYIFGLLLITLFSTIPVFASSFEEDNEIGGEGYGENALLLEFEIVNLLLIGSLITIIISSIIKNKNSSHKIIVGYFLLAVISFGFTRVFYILADRGIIFVADDTLEVWWHFIFYIGMIMLIFGIQKSVNIRQIKSKKSFLNQLKFPIIAVGIVVTFVFFSAETLDKPFLSIFSDTFWAKIGIQHLLAFSLSSLVVFYLLDLKMNLKIQSKIFVNFLLIFLVVTTSYHLWELLTESMEIIELDEKTIERTEQLIATVMFSILLVLFLSLRKENLDTIFQSSLDSKTNDESGYDLMDKTRNISTTKSELT